MALSLLCGGLGVAEASVHVDEVAGGTKEVYTTDETYNRTEVDFALAAKGAASDVASNRTDIDNLKTAVGGLGSGLTKDVADQKVDIATNRANINNLDGKLANLTTTVSGKADEAAVTTALGDKANTDLSNLTADGVNKIKNTMSADMDLKANKTYVDNALANKADTGTVTALDGRVGVVEGKVTTLETKVGDASGGLVKDVADLKAQGITLNTELGNKADQTALDAATNRITANEGNITALKKKTANLTDDGKELTGMTTVRGTTVSGDNVEAGALKVTGEISNGAGVTTTLADIHDSMTQTATNKTDIAALQTTTNNQQTAIDGLNTKTTQISYNAAEGTTVHDVKFKDTEVDANGKGLTGVSTLHTTGAATIGGTLTAAGVNAGTEAITGGSLSVTGEVKGNRVDAGAGEIKTTGVVNAGTLSTAGDATVGGDLNATGKVSGKGLDAGTGDITGGSLNVTGEVKGNRVDAGAGEIKTTGAVNAGTLNTTGDATVGGELNATGKVSGKGLDAGTGDITGGSLNVTGEVKGSSVDAGAGEIKTTGAVNAGTLSTTGNATVGGDLSAKNTEITGTLHATGETKLDNKLTVTGEATFKEKVTMEKDLEVKGELKTDKISMKNTDTDPDGTKHDSATTITADSITHFGEIEKSGVITKSQFTHTEEGSETYAKKGDATDWTETRSDVKADGVKTEVKDSKQNRTNTSQTADGIKGYATDEDGNKTYTKVTATENSFQVQDKDGKNKNHQVNTKDSSVTEITNGDGKTTKTEQTATDIKNTAKDGTITNDAQNIVNNATGDMTNTVGGKLTTTVTGQATEEFNGGLNTTVTGTENHTVNGKQINTVTEGQENIISGGQTNTITGGQINNITGDQTTTITGNKTETVEGKVTENFNGGQETNVTGDQTTNVSGTQTTTATDIKRNASSGMIDTIDNDYGTNTETKVAGKTTTDVSIKGTGEEGKYIRGANESRDYLIKGTLKNTETKTVEKTSTEITDGNGKTSATIQDVNNLAGSVTNGTETGVSGIHANDNSVSIDSIVTDGNKYSVINQKKGSIQSTVVDGTNSTVILQDKDNVTIASSNGTVAIGGKDIVSNAQDTITNTAGTKITDKAGDSTVVTENGKGTTFTKTGSTAFSTAADAPTDTNIAGNHITTGRVDANELGVSDKDDQGNTADFSVKAGEGIKGSATDKDGNKTYTKVTATENSFQVQDKDGMIKNHQVNTKDKSENTITNGDKTNTVTSTADGTTFNNSKANTAFEGGRYTDTTIKGNTITTGKVTMDYADVMKDLGVRGNANITGKTTTGSLEVKGESKLTGDVTMESNATVGNNLTVNGTTKTKTLNVTENAEVGGTLKVAKKATFEDSVSIAKDLTVGGDVTAKSYKVGGNTYISADGINANDQKITNVADGSISEGSKDAVNGGQLYGVKRDLEHQVDKVGANAAAMANLRPMEFDPSSKWNIAAAIGNYGSETAAALGAFYRPNDNVMVNLSTAFGTGENMVGGGVSVRLGKGGNKLSREESNALKAQVADLSARMDALLSVLNPNMSKDFPDVPENHWAYEAVSRLAGNDIVQGYPDGEFHGDRTMTRYEMAEIIYNALSRGAEAEKELVEEFKPELQAMAASEKATAERAEG